MVRHAKQILAIIFSFLLIPTVSQAKDIRKPVSDNAAFVAQVAVDCTATCYPQEHLKDPGSQWQKINEPKYSLYYFLIDWNIKDKGGNAAYASCTQYICAVLSVIDEDIYKASQGPDKFINYCISNPEKYEYLGNIPFASLRDGDVLCSSNHTAMFVENTTKRHYGYFLGNVAEAGYTTHSYPGVDLWYKLGRHTLGELNDWSNYVVFRVR